MIGIILTGANSDGSIGLKKIREYGGLGIVQDPDSAEANSMPSSAIRIAGADHVWGLDEIGVFLGNLKVESSSQVVRSGYD